MYCIMKVNSNGENEFIGHSDATGYYVAQPNNNSGICMFLSFKTAYDAFTKITENKELVGVHISKIWFTRIDTNIIDANISRINDNIDALKLKIQNEERKLKTILSSSSGINEVEWDNSITPAGAIAAVTSYIFDQVSSSTADASIYHGDVLVVKPNGYVHNRTHNLKPHDVTITVSDDIVVEVKNKMRETNDAKNGILSFL